MLTTQFAARMAVVTCVLLAVGRVGEAEPMLLMEITQRGDDPISQGGASGGFTFNVFFSGTSGEPIGMVGPYSTADVGRTFDLDQSSLAIVEPWMQSEGSGLQIYSGYSGRFSSSPDGLWTNPGDFHTTINRFATRLGVGFTGYELTRITQTIDEIQWTRPGGTWYGVGQQTVRFYGEIVPEPSTLVLIIFISYLYFHRTRPHHPVFAA